MDYTRQSSSFGLYLGVLVERLIKKRFMKSRKTRVILWVGKSLLNVAVDKKWFKVTRIAIKQLFCRI